MLRRATWRGRRPRGNRGDGEAHFRTCDAHHHSSLTPDHAFADFAQERQTGSQKALSPSLATRRPEQAERRRGKPQTHHEQSLAKCASFTGGNDSTVGMKVRRKDVTANADAGRPAAWQGECWRDESKRLAVGRSEVALPACRWCRCHGCCCHSCCRHPGSKVTSRRS